MALLHPFVQLKVASFKCAPLLNLNRNFPIQKEIEKNKKIKKITEHIIITAAEKTIYVTFRGHRASDTHKLIALYILNISEINLTGKQAIVFEYLKRKDVYSLFASSVLLHSYVKCGCYIFFHSSALDWIDVKLKIEFNNSG